MNNLLCLSVILGFVTVQYTSSQNCPADLCGRQFNSSANVVTVGILANIHRASSNGQQCSKIIKRNVEMAEGIRWVFNQLTVRNYIPGVALDVVVLDACSREDVAVHELVSFFPNFQHPSCQQRVNGVIGLVSSSQSHSLLESLGKVKVPIISPTSSAPSLSDQSSYPSFFRTVPSAVSEVKALFNTVKDLQMEYIAVVHSDDLYGSEATREFEFLAKNRVCIGGKYSVTDQDIIYKLFRLQDNLPNNMRNLPVVYIGNYEGAEQLVRSASTDLSSNIDVSQRFLWVFSSSLGVDSEIFTGNSKIGRNAISVSPHSIEVQEFTDYWLETLEQYLQSNHTFPHQWYYQEYIYDSLACSSPVSCLRRINSINLNYEQSAYFHIALDAAYIYAHTFKDLHNSLCNGRSGLCNDMRLHLQDVGSTTNAISDIRFTYDDSTFPFLPVALQNSARTMQFHSSNDLAISPHVYDIQSYECDRGRDQCNILKVGNMTGNRLLLGKQDIKFYLNPSTDEPTTADLLMPIQCQRNCEICAANTSQELPFASIWGEFLIVSFFSATQPGSDAFGCSDEIHITESVDLLEAMLFAVDVFNGDLNHPEAIWVHGRPQLFGKLGIIAFNDCRNPLYAGQLLSNWLTKKIELRDSAGRFYDPDKCVAVIGGSYSSINLRLLPITKAENLLQVSATATSVQLEFDSSFLRTIPADDIQVQVMVDFVKRLGSNAVSVVYQDDSYGIKGYEELKKRTYEAELCISKVVKIPINIRENDVHDVLDRLRLGRPTRIVILFTVWREALTILKVANSRANKKEFVWIGTESWGKRQNMLSDETDPEALGSFTVLVPTEPSAHFQEYLSALDPDSNARNPFFRPWWENLHNCRLPTKTTPNPPNRCSSGLTLRYHPEDLYADLVRKAVWSIGIGLSATVSDLCRSSRQFCPRLRTAYGLEQLVKNVKKVEMNVLGERRRLFTNRGDGNIDEDVLNVQLEANQKIYKQVARFHRSNGFNITRNYTFYDEQRNEVSVPYSTCTTCNCIFKHKDDPLIHLSKYIRRHGDMYLAAVLPVHSSTRSYEISMDGIVSLEALLAAVEIANDRMRHELGLIVYDGYGSRDLTDWHIVSLVNSGKYLGLEQYNINDSMIVAFLTDSDQNSLVTRKTVTDNEIIHFDMGKSLSPTSDDGSYYFSLGYNIPWELSAIVAFITRHRWSKVQLLCSATTDSAEVCNMIQELFKKDNICAVRKQIVDKSTFQTSADNVMDEVAEGTNVVVALIEQEDVAPFMDALGATDVRTPLIYPIFIGWSRFTRGVSHLSGTYKDVCNNSVGFQETLLSLSDAGKQVLQAVKIVEEDPERNPWLTANVARAIHTKDLKSQYRVIEDAVKATNVLSDALQDLLSAECNNDEGLNDEGLCDELLRLPDWRKRLLRNVNNRYKRISRVKKVFDIVTYFTEDVPGAPYRTQKIGEYNVDQGRTSLTSRYILSNVSSKCEVGQCKVCDFKDHSEAFSPWGIAFLIIVPLLAIILAILLACIIRDRLKSSRDRDIKETYLSIPAGQHAKPPPLPSRESRGSRSLPIASVYSPGGSDVSATSFVSASSYADDNRRLPSSVGMPRQPSGTSVQDGSARGINPNPGTSTMRSDRNGYYLNPAFSSEEDNSKRYGMSLDLMSPQHTSDKPVTYSQLQFENPNQCEHLPNRDKGMNHGPSVHASGPIQTNPSGGGFVSTV